MMYTRVFHISAHIFLGGSEVVHWAGIDQVKCALYLLIAALMVREMWADPKGNQAANIDPAPTEVETAAATITDEI